MRATINDLLFPVFLFAVYFCAASVIVYTSKQQHQGTEEIVVSKPQASLEVEVEVTTNNSSQKIRQKSSGEFSLPNDLHAQADQIISHLNKRQSRKLCKPLGIQQKCGKVEKSLTFIKAEIRALFKDEPERVIAAIKEKLPELICVLPETSEQAQRIAS